LGLKKLLALQDNKKNFIQILFFLNLLVSFWFIRHYLIITIIKNAFNSSRLSLSNSPPLKHILDKTLQEKCGIPNQQIHSYLISTHSHACNKHHKLTPNNKKSLQIMRWNISVKWQPYEGQNIIIWPTDWVTQLSN